MTTIIGRGDLAQLVATSTEISQAQARKVLDAVFDQIAASTEAGHQVRVTGLGTFQFKDRAARMVRNPRTGETVEAPASRRLTFKASRPRPA